MELKEGVLYKFETPSCHVCKQIDLYLQKANVEPEKFDISKDEEALQFIQGVTEESAMPILVIKKNDDYQTLSGMKTEKEIKVFLENL